RLHVVNDFVAAALSVPHLEPDDVVQIGTTGPIPDPKVIGVLGPGTGLGVAGLIRVGGAWVPLATEGGHATMSPFDDRESEILAVLRREFGHVSAERLLSGQGLSNIHSALGKLEGQASEPVEPEAITAGALEGTDARMVEAVEIFCLMLGTVASNVALTLGARVGIYIAGGIVPQLGRMFETSGFRQRFEDKGRFRGYLAAIPTFVIIHDAAAFVGLRSLAEASCASAPDGASDDAPLLQSGDFRSGIAEELAENVVGCAAERWTEDAYASRRPRELWHHARDDHLAHGFLDQLHQVLAGGVLRI